MDIKTFAKEHKQNEQLITALATKITESLAPKFGTPTIALVDTDKCYADRFDATKTSTKMLEVTVPIPHAGLRIKASVYAYLTRKSDGDEISYSAQLPGKGVVTADAHDKEQFLAHVELAASSWKGWEAATLAADNRLRGIKSKAASVSTGPTLERPRLVKTVKPAPTAPPAAS